MGGKLTCLKTTANTQRYYAIFVDVIDAYRTTSLCVMYAIWLHTNQDIYGCTLIGHVGLCSYKCVNAYI